MTLCTIFDGVVHVICRIVLAIAMTAAPVSPVLAQGATQAVRQRVQGLGAQPAESPPQSFREGNESGPSTEPAGPAAGTLDTTYVAPTAGVIIVFRPAQIMAAPAAELMPTEVLSAVGMKYLGIDPATVDEVVAFADLSNMAAPAYGVTMKFNQPFRGSAIAPHLRPSVQLSELAGRKYLQSSHPLFPSYYGTDNKTLIAAPDATLRPLIESSGQPATGPLLDRAHNVSAGHDLYLAVDVVNLRSLLEMDPGMMPPGVPAEARQLLDSPNLITAAELTLNISAPGPTSLVLHANDEAAAEQLEAMMDAATEASSEGRQPAADDPVAQAIARYQERMSQSFGRQRNGASLTCFHIDGQDSEEQRFVSSLVILGFSMLVPILESARNNGGPPPAMEPVAGPEGAPEH